MDEALISARDLNKQFATGTTFKASKGVIHAVDGVSFDLFPGETLGLVGESGSGKSTIARLVMGLIKPTSGDVLFENKSIFRMEPDTLRKIRRDMQMIFQDPFSSLDPRMKVFDIIAEPLVTHLKPGKNELSSRVFELLHLVGLKKFQANYYPHQFSGGQRQRIGIARAIALQPRVVICDEPVSALDVSVQSQILNLLKDLQEKMSLTYLFISHDLHIVRFMSDKVAVMYMGKMVELSPTRELFSRPLHPYTRALISAVPNPDPRMRNKPRLILEGELPNPLKPPKGCRFHTRCPLVKEKCREEAPSFMEVEPSHMVACHFPLTAGKV